MLSDIGLGFGCSYVGPGVGLRGPCGSLPTWDLPWLMGELLLDITSCFCTRFLWAG